LKKALFLDRDGIINIDYGYVYQIEKFEFTEEIFSLLKLFIKHNYKLFIVTNQSGIGRNYYTKSDFATLTEWMLNEFKQREIEIVSVHHCYHAPEKNCNCRKPKTGMIDEILSQNEIDLENSWMIGDKQSDIDLAKNSKIKHTIAIGERKIENATYSFKTILECKLFLEENQAIINA
jgi:D-glycero-D-manno-heptose 1,7-bisphosphate phosphatase